MSYGIVQGVAPVVVTGASRGFGYAVATALCRAGRPVIGVARDPARLEAMQETHGELFLSLIHI